MVQPIQIVIIFFAVFALSRTILRLKDNKITSLEFVFWTMVWLGLIVGASTPSAVIKLSDLSGLGRGLDVLILVSIILLFYLIFRAYVQIEMAEQEITQLVSKIAIKEVKKIQKTGLKNNNKKVSKK